jgi:N-methylhydantoinase B
MPTVIFGIDPRTGRTFIDNSADTIAAHCNAVAGQDGWGSMNVSFGNLIRATAEINESIFPQRQLARDYEIDSGGPGKWRGCPGSRYVKRVTAPCSVFTYQVGMKYPMPGIAGGRPGGPNRFTLRYGTERAEVVKHTAPMVPLAAGEAVEYVFGGGGGWGDPFERDPERVREDVLDEYVSIEGARRDYGVALRGRVEDPSLEIDWEETKRLRGAAG